MNCIDIVLNLCKIIIKNVFLFQLVGNPTPTIDPPSRRSSKTWSTSEPRSLRWDHMNHSTRCKTTGESRSKRCCSISGVKKRYIISSTKFLFPLYCVPVVKVNYRLSTGYAVDKHLSAWIMK